MFIFVFKLIFIYIQTSRSKKLFSLNWINFAVQTVCVDHVHATLAADACFF